MHTRPGALPSATIGVGEDRPAGTTTNRPAPLRPSRRGSCCRPEESPAVVRERRMAAGVRDTIVSSAPDAPPARARSRGCRKMGWSGDLARSSDRRNCVTIPHANRRVSTMADPAPGALWRRSLSRIHEKLWGTATYGNGRRPRPEFPGPEHSRLREERPSTRLVGTTFGSVPHHIWYYVIHPSVEAPRSARRCSPGRGLRR